MKKYVLDRPAKTLPDSFRTQAGTCTVRKFGRGFAVTYTPDPRASGGRHPRLHAFRMVGWVSDVDVDSCRLTLQPFWGYTDPFSLALLFFGSWIIIMLCPGIQFLSGLLFALLWTVCISGTTYFFSKNSTAGDVWYLKVEEMIAALMHAL